MAVSDGGCFLCSFAFWGVAIEIALYFFRRYIKGAQFKEKVSAKGKIAIVTGANTGLGKETVRGLNLAGAKVYMLCRSEERANAAKVSLVKMGCDATRLIFEKCDLASFKNVRECAKRIEAAEDHIDILVNNAGIMMYPRYELTEDGHEMTWQSNLLGPFLLTELLLPLLKKSEEGRIVNVSALLHKVSGALNLETIDSKEAFGRVYPYARSKLAKIMHARELSRRLNREEGNKVTVNSLHPGVCITDLQRYFLFAFDWMKTVLWYFMKTDRDGAQTSLYLALSPSVKGISGQYFSDCAISTTSKYAQDDLACKQLYDYSIKAVGLE